MSEYDVNDPLIEALESLRELDKTFLETHSATEAREEEARRVLTLFLVADAINELAWREEPADPDAIRAEMVRLEADTGEFAFDPRLLLDLELGFRADGDELNANTVLLAAAWFKQRQPEE